VLVIVGPTAGAGSAADLERETRAALAKLASVEVMPAAPLDLEAVQLALDCTDESVSCLAAVARKLQAQVLLVPSVTRHNGSTVLRLLRFDADGGDEPRVLSRAESGRKLSRAQLAAIADMTAELFAADESARKAAAAAPPEAEAPAPEPATQPAPAPGPAPSHVDAARPVPIGPLIVGGAGVAALVAGAVMYAAMESTERKYASQPITNKLQADAADRTRALGHRQATEASVLLGLGGAAVAAAGIWLAVDLSRPRSEQGQAVLLPLLAPHTAGLAVSGTLERRQ
jgi:hypothetical protein